MLISERMCGWAALTSNCEGVYGLGRGDLVLYLWPVRFPETCIGVGSSERSMVAVRLACI